LLSGAFAETKDDIWQPGDIIGWHFWNMSQKYQSLLCQTLAKRTPFVMPCNHAPSSAWKQSTFQYTITNQLAIMAACEKVFDTAELHEIILLSLDIRTLFLAQRVNRTWQAVIISSQSL
jgi:hypothetical protein